MSNISRIFPDGGFYETVTLRLDEYAGISVSMTIARATLRSIQRACRESGEDVHATLRGVALETMAASARQSAVISSREDKKRIRSLV